MFPGRQLPLDVVMGKEGEQPPLNVSHLSRGCIVLHGDTASHQLKRQIPFSNEGKIWENEDLFSKLVELNSMGLPFQYQPKDMEAPDGLMAWWQETGKLDASFKEISWRSLDEWCITIVKPPIVGVRGWTGPKDFNA